MQPWRWLAYKERSLRDYNWSISGGIEPFNWLLARFNTSRLINSPIRGGISPDNLLDDRSRCLSLDRLLISIGTVPKSSFMLKSRNARLGKDENENPWSVPFKVELARFNLITLLLGCKKCQTNCIGLSWYSDCWRIGCIVRENPWRQWWLGFILKSGFPIY